MDLGPGEVKKFHFFYLLSGKVRVLSVESVKRPHVPKSARTASGMRAPVMYPELASAIVAKSNDPA